MICTKEILQLTSEEQARLDKCSNSIGQEVLNCYGKLFYDFIHQSSRYNYDISPCPDTTHNNSEEPEHASCIVELYRKYLLNGSLFYLTKICDGLANSGVANRISDPLAVANVCYYYVAILTDDKCICEQAPYKFLKDTCIANFAIIHNQLELCDKIEPNVVYKELTSQFNSNDAINYCKRRELIIK